MTASITEVNDTIIDAMDVFIDKRIVVFFSKALFFVLLGAFVVKIELVVPMIMLFMFSSMVLGNRTCLLCKLYTELYIKRYKRKQFFEIEDFRPTRFSAVVHSVVLLGATFSFFAFGHPEIGWSLVMLVALLAFFCGFLGVCVVDDLYKEATLSSQDPSPNSPSGSGDEDS